MNAATKTPDQFFFEKITDSRDRQQVFDLLTYERTKVLIKTESGGYFSSQLSYTTPPSTFIVHDYFDQLKSVNSKNTLAEELQSFKGTLHFELHGIKYFCKGNFYIRHSTVKVDIEELYYVQRRNSFRVNIPESYKIMFQIETLNNHDKKIKCKVLDLSSKGIKLQAQEKIEKGSVLTGYLIHDDSKPILFKGNVRHCSQNIRNKTFFSVGIELIDQTPDSENFLFLFTLDLYRKIYRRKDL